MNCSRTRRPARVRRRAPAELVLLPSAESAAVVLIDTSLRAEVRAIDVDGARCCRRGRWWLRTRLPRLARSTQPGVPHLSSLCNPEPDGPRTVTTTVLDRTSLQPITTLTKGDGGPVLSPDGRRIARRTARVDRRGQLRGACGDRRRRHRGRDRQAPGSLRVRPQVTPPNPCCAERVATMPTRDAMTSRAPRSRWTVGRRTRSAGRRTARCSLWSTFWTAISVSGTRPTER